MLLSGTKRIMFFVLKILLVRNHRLIHFLRRIVCKPVQIIHWCFLFLWHHRWAHMLGFVVCKTVEVVEKVGCVLFVGSGGFLWQGLWLLLVLGLFRQHWGVYRLALLEVVEVVKIRWLLRGVRFVAYNWCFYSLRLMSLLFLLCKAILGDKRLIHFFWLHIIKVINIILATLIQERVNWWR